ncbi:MAG: DUF3795 domain-containing protein [Firmicutes bacterium]|nr:DUF3795 domain-containing protein [Bacillota bacterium]
MKFQEQRGIGYCGLACVLCSSEDCPGCVAKTADGHGCNIGKCTAAKGIEGCFACSGNPCGEAMLQNKRIRAFNRFAQEFGTQALIDRLRVNHENGIAYHKPGESTGDYDTFETEEEVYRVLRYGR